jgi:hypothetical protein
MEAGVGPAAEPLSGRRPFGIGLIAKVVIKGVTASGNRFQHFEKTP